MGLLKILRKIKRKEKEMRILMLGLDCSGKCIAPSTTVLCKSSASDDEWQTKPASLVLDTDLLCNEHGEPVPISHIAHGESNTMMRVVTESSKGRHAKFTFDVTPEHDLIAEWCQDHVLSCCCCVATQSWSLNYYTFDQNASQFRQVTLRAHLASDSSNADVSSRFATAEECHANLFTQLAAVGRWNDETQSGGFLVSGSKIKIQAQHWSKCLSQIDAKDRNSCVRAVRVSLDTKRESPEDRDERLLQYMSVTPIDSPQPQPWLGFTVRSKSHIFCLGNGLMTGNSTVLKAYLGEDLTSISPTLGFNIKTLAVDNYKVNMWDVGGQQTIRSYWRNYFELTDGLIFVVDSADRTRLPQVKHELMQLLQQEKLAGASLLILANKQDLAGAVSSQDLQAALDLDAINAQGRHWHIEACSATTSQAGLREGIEWIVKDVAKRIYMLD